ncbi:hypothetical protein RSO01_87300 [Reyranella soli]|uniref:Uncharacterized protein n=1 Tax=Reyranella soli TaxID=1230389 RepID=A0A512NRJ9_9HYPH|nr:hypothetical protein RSO01_87300 [Reyranella soli]
MQFNATNGASPTLNVNSLGERSRFTLTLLPLAGLRPLRERSRPMQSLASPTTAAAAPIVYWI